MTADDLETSDSSVRLIEPNIERDAALGVEWLEGSEGRHTLQLMGVADKDNKPTTFEKEKQRVDGFIHGKDQLNWMIEYKGKVIGGIWVDLKATSYIPSPHVSIMLGDRNVRGKGVGQVALKAVIKYLRQLGVTELYARHLTHNTASEALLQKLEFKQFGTTYSDEDTLEWQNVRLAITV